MEHLPRGACALDLQIPYICTEPYDFDGDWLDYPSHKGIKLSNLRFHIFRYYAPEKLGPFFQNWLFFGLLQAILPFKVDFEDFIRLDEKGRKFITTEKLLDHISKWREQERPSGSTKKIEIWKQNFSTLKEAASFTTNLSDWPSYGSSEVLVPLISREIALSFAFLGLTLAAANNAILNPNAQSPIIFWSFGYLLLEHMEINGWCPFLVSGLERTVSLEAKFFAAEIGPPKVKRNHRKCSDNGCVAASLRTRHLEKDCECSLLSPKMQLVADFISQDTTPLLRFQSRETETGLESFLDVFRDEPGMSYVAISHVWSDGLGNEKNNSLPKCQLFRIQETIDEMYKTSTPFWMDTLLVPAGKEFEVFKKRALNSMAKIYKNANSVLVIDSGVAASCSKSSSATEIILHVTLSNWIRRLWTLQEGVFANAIHILVSDGTVSLASVLQQKSLDYLGDDLEIIFGRSFGKPFYPVRDTKLKARPSEAQVIYTIREVSKRTSTFKKDEALCIAFLLDIDTTEIVEARDLKNTMPILLEALNHSIPPCMILLPGKRNIEPGYRWAPQSFLLDYMQQRSLQSHPFQVLAEFPSSELIMRPSGSLDPRGRGLNVMFPGLRLGKIHTEYPLSDNQFIVDVSNGTSDNEVIVDGKPPLVWRITYSKDDADKPWNEMSPMKGTSESMAIIICAYGPNWRSTAESLLVRLRETKEGDGDGVLFVERICRVLVSGTPEYDNFSWLRELEKRITGTWLPVTQMWCVD